MGLFLPVARIRYMILAASMSPDSLTGAEDSISRLKAGDLGALSELMTHYQHRMYRFLLRITQDPAAADDLFQQTWMRVMERIGRYDARRQFQPWLFSVARNLAIDHLRRRRPESLDTAEDSTVAPMERLAASERDPLEQLLEFERGAALVSAIGSLPVIHREVVTLRFEEEMSLDQIADVCDVPLSTVKSRLLRALANLRKGMSLK
jgi:RNA polymerase sigma-70 factor (ECF subfamily)